jgi:hypothetical protein
MRTFAMLVLLAATASAATSPIRPTTTNNDDSCDIALQPAATLLLPYFEVDFRSPQTTARSTIFTIVNTSPLPQIVHVTLWTDWSFPAFDFNIFLTGYDMVLINLYDIFARATIVPGPYPGAGGTSSNTLVPTNPTTGSQPAQNDANPRIPSLALCGNLPGVFSPALQTDLQLIFTTGKGTGALFPSCAGPVGGVHANAVGYATIDVAPACHTSLPSEPDYFNLILYDNVLTGDYIDYLPSGTVSTAVGGPLVHLRAIPEGGAAGSVVASDLPYTFYSRFTSGTASRTIDRRQPLPSTFAARFVDDAKSGFRTSFKIWRESVVESNPRCTGYSANSGVPFADVVRFDEHENATVIAGYCAFCFAAAGISSTSSLAASSPLLPPKSTSGDPAGWFYLNIDAGGARASQSWVIASMFGPPRYAVDVAAPALGNGCSPATATGARIEPAGATAKNDDSCDIALQPAATLLLPYFDVDFKSSPATAVMTLFTVQNVSPLPQIANVTLWTDWGFPAISFPLFLTGYDTQSINLYDVFAHGTIAFDASIKTPVPVNPSHGAQPAGNFANRNFLGDAAVHCGSGTLGQPLSAAMLADLQLLFTVGKGSDVGCTTAVGGAHADAVGYATIDVVADCAATTAASPDYFTSLLLYDNVLAGDYQQLTPSPRPFATGGPLVHIRAVPEGGPVGSLVGTSLPYTFYDRYTAGLPSRTTDRRQPLPSTFAAWWISGGPGALNSKLVLWREGVSAGACSGATAARSNSSLPVEDIVRFDEHENAAVIPYVFSFVPYAPGTAAVVVLSSTSSFLPPMTAWADTEGWLYMNLNNYGSSMYSVARTPEGAARNFGRSLAKVRQSQNWVISSTSVSPSIANNAWGFDVPATALGNGCSPAPPEKAQIQPAANPTP